MYIAPMLPESAESPFSDDSYLYEPKLDGHRLILSKQGLETRLWACRRSECTRQYPELHNLPILGNAVLDGEVCCTDPETGSLDYGCVMERSRLNKKDKIKSFSNHRPVTFMVWDILLHDGRDLRGLPLIKRRSILESVVGTSDYLSLVPQIDGSGEELWNTVLDRSMEGMVAKRKSSVYVSRRSRDWLKMMNYRYADVYLVGYRRNKFGWLAHIEENGKLHPAGIIELGVPAAARKEFHRMISKLRAGEDPNFVYIQPQIKARVKYCNRTRHGLLRNPLFVNFIQS